MSERIATLICLAIAAMPTALAAAEADAVPVPATRAPLGGGELLSMSLNLLLVIGAILVFAWLYMRSQGLRGGRAGCFRVLAAQPLGAKEKVVLLQVGEQQLVVGISAGGMNTLLVPEKPVVAETAQADADEGFAGRLRAALARSRS